MNVIFLLCLILGLVGCLMEYIFPFYNYSLHTMPITALRNTSNGVAFEQMQYYGKMKKITLIHTAVSTVLTIGAQFAVPWLSLPTLAYVSYHTWMFSGSKHEYSRCEHAITTAEKDDPYSESQHVNPYASLFNVIPWWLLEPAAFAIWVWVFCIGYIYCFPKKRSKVLTISLAVWLLIMFYTYSFLQISKESRNLQNIQYKMALTEFRYKCNVAKITHREKSTVKWLTLEGLHYDKHGYIISKKCQDLENRMYELKYTLIDDVYKTFTRSGMTILKEISNSISLKDKLLLLCITLFIAYIRCFAKPKPYQKKSSAQKKNGKGESEGDL